jgi:hypothetical protein
MHMGPQNTQTPTPNPYDFLNAPTGPKRTLFGTGGPKNKVLVSVVFVLVVLLLVVIGFSFISSLGKKDYSAYNTLLKTQYELVRITELGTDKARTAEVRQFAATVQYTTITERDAVVTLLTKANQEVLVKQLAQGKDTTNDKALAAAEQANRYDEEVLKIMNTLLSSYYKQIKDVALSASTKSEKALVAQLQTNAKVVSDSRK